MLAREALHCLSHVPVLFALVIFGTGTLCFAQASLDCDPTVYVYQITGMTGTHYHAQLSVEMVSCNVFPQAALELQSTQSLSPKLLGLQA
jgi:hypothetical protein